MIQRIVDYNSLFADVKGVETPYRTSWSLEMEGAMQGQLLFISALITYKQWKIDNKYGNKHTYKNLREEFRKENKAAALLLDESHSKNNYFV